MRRKIHRRDQTVRLGTLVSGLALAMAAVPAVAAPMQPAGPSTVLSADNPCAAGKKCKSGSTNPCGGSSRCKSGASNPCAGK